MLIDESAKVEVCHIIRLNTRLTLRWFICLRPNYSSQMANSSQTHNLSLKYKFWYWFTTLFCNVMFDPMLIAIWFVVLPVISCRTIILRDKGWWEEGQKRERRDTPIVVANSNHSFHFLQGLLQILGNWFMIYLASLTYFLKRGEYGHNNAWKHNWLLRKGTVLSNVFNCFCETCLQRIMVLVFINAFPPLTTFLYPLGFFGSP